MSWFNSGAWADETVWMTDLCEILHELYQACYDRALARGMTGTYPWLTVPAASDFYGQGICELGDARPEPIEELRYRIGVLATAGPSEIRFYNFVDSAYWTLSTLLAKGSYGSSWITADRATNPAIWLQMKEALEELTYVREIRDLTNPQIVTKKLGDAFYEEPGDSPLPSISATQDASWADLHTGVFDAIFGLNIQQASYQWDRSAPPNYHVIEAHAYVIQEISAVAQSYNSIGAFSSASIRHSQGLGTDTPAVNGITAQSIYDNDGILYNWNPPLTGDVLWGDASKTEAWANLALSGRTVIWNFTVPGTRPIPNHAATSDWTVDLNQYSEIYFLPVSFQINRNLLVGNGLTYG